MTSQLTAKICTLAQTGKLTRVALERLLGQVNDPWEAARGVLRARPVNPLRCQKHAARHMLGVLN